jgi:flagellar biosynthesis protein FliP
MIHRWLSPSPRGEGRRAASRWGEPPNTEGSRQSRTLWFTPPRLALCASPPLPSRGGWSWVTHVALTFAVIYLGTFTGSLANAQAINVDLGSGSGLTERVFQLLALVTVLSIAPSVLIMTTSFVRIIVVLSLLRTAIGLQQAPPNAVLVSLALFLTAFVMAPTWSASYEQGVKPVMDEQVELTEAYPKIVAPLRTFMLAHTRQADLKLFVDMAKLDPAPATPEALPMRVCIPAFMISELRRAFEIGFMLFIPFLIIDLVVSSLLMSMGMMMVPPVTISLPFKVIFFVLVDGWRLVAGSLVQGFAAGPPPGG